MTPKMNLATRETPRFISFISFIHFAIIQDVATCGTVWVGVTIKMTSKMNSTTQKTLLSIYWTLLIQVLCIRSGREGVLEVEVRETENHTNRLSWGIYLINIEGRISYHRWTPNSPILESQCIPSRFFFYSPGEFSAMLRGTNFFNWIISLYKALLVRHSKIPTSRAV